ncbi:hypothetical protein F2P81_025775 [Scophthalmus maximus]|uniref:Uncharacterized protein n=1 Tax=Scophthalmus maximus TaxID=52904 RepID=A0A6A4RSG7_SCOMX|nr:hypothetical protein F2P81_025775 [Scophthalmus maximus]
MKMDDTSSLTCCGTGRFSERRCPLLVETGTSATSQCLRGKLLSCDSSQTRSLVNKTHRSRGEFYTFHRVFKK